MRVDFSILNQLATPAIYAASLSLRPAFGFAGRVFIDTDTPSTGIYRDTGAAWEQIAGSGGGGGGTLQTVTDAGDTTTNNMIFNDPTGSATQGLQYKKNGVEKWALNQYNNGGSPAYFGIYDADKAYNIMTFLTNARVGVFNDNPSYSFDVTGDFRATGKTYLGTAVGVNNVLIGSTTDTGEKLQVTGGMKLTQGADFNQSSGNNDFRYRTVNSAATFFIDASADSIGIGTVNPVAKLHLFTSSAALAPMYVEQAVAGQPCFQMTCPTQAFALFVNTTGGGVYSFGVNNSAEFVWTKAASLLGGLVTHRMGQNGEFTAIGSGVFGSNTVSPASAALSVITTTKGFLPPVMTTAQKNAIAAPASGLVVYDSVLNKLCLYTGAAWETVTSV